ncbi:sushi domain-containing protein 6 isoform X1 [Poecilia reticulata]|uniref:sushi domain-containing protein 6 isoform X1 n=1 Tax=Poecilia reticulata TaxID=8081 RepID=UPI0004A4C5DC|nr:PREDICTED: sushi domain-containing protein 6-like isoform X1 [Poecilia reticulata]
MSQSEGEQQKRSHLLLSRSRDRQLTAELRPPRPHSEPGTEPGVRLPAPPRRRPTGSFMSAPVQYSWPSGRICLVCGLLLLASSPLLSAGRLNCSHPLVPEHGGFRCDPSPCRGFPPKTVIRIFCENGYHTGNKKPSSRCQRGRWAPIPPCIPMKDGPSMKPDGDMPSMATTAVGVSIFLLTTTACLIVKSRLYPCRSHGRRSSDQLDLMVDGLSVSLPSYEEAVYGSWGQRIAPCSAPGPTQLLLAQEEPGFCPSPPAGQPDGSHQPLLSVQSPENAPPPYEEVPSSRSRDRLNDGNIRHLSDDKDA